MCQTWGRICGFRAGCCPSSGRVYLLYGVKGREVEAFQSLLFVSFLLHSVWFGKAAEVFTLRQEAVGFVWWPRDYRRAECGESQAPVSQSPQSKRLCGLSHQLVKVVVKVLELFLHHLAVVLQRKTQEETNLLLSLRVCVKQKKHAVLINTHMGQGLDELWCESTGQRSAQRQIQVELVMSKFSSRGYIPGFYIFHILWRQSLCVWLYVLEAISG